MLRTCMTAMHMFKNHPNRANIKFIVLPAAKEGLHLCNDISGPIDPIIKIFSKSENCYDINFDFSLVYSYGIESTWQMNIVADLEMTKKAYSTLKNERIDENNFDIN